MSGLLYSSRNNPPDGKAKGFPSNKLQNNSAGNPLNGNNVNFVPAAKAATAGVVHIKTLYEINSGNLYYKDGGVSAPPEGLVRVL